MKDWFTHEFKPMGSLFPNMAPEEFDSAVAESWGVFGVRDDGRALFGIKRDREAPDHWAISHSDAITGEHKSTVRPVIGAAVVAMCGEMDDVGRYTFEMQGGYRLEVDDGLSVYFIQPVGGGLVKIGVSYSPHARLSALQIGCPVELQIIKTIPAVRNKTERDVHRAFAAHRVRGEWFSPAVLSLELPQ